MTVSKGRHKSNGGLVVGFNACQIRSCLYDVAQSFYIVDHVWILSILSMCKVIVYYPGTSCVRWLKAQSSPRQCCSCSRFPDNGYCKSAVRHFVAAWRGKALVGRPVLVASGPLHCPEHPPTVNSLLRYSWVGRWSGEWRRGCFWVWGQGQQQSLPLDPIPPLHTLTPESLYST